jgi:neutral ceramidase
MSTIALLLAAVTAAAQPAEAAPYRAGVARAVITPGEPVWMSGYASRNRPSEGKVHDLWAKALAIEDSEGGRVVILTADLIALPAEFCRKVAERVGAKHALKREQIVFAASHTHSGPMMPSNLGVMLDPNPEVAKALADYHAALEDKLVALIGAALADLSPARIDFGQGKVDFAINRREPTQTSIRLGVHPEGPVDHSVPVLRVSGADGSVRAVLFGYACHNTTLGGDQYALNGDYAGFAQIALEEALPETAAMFMILCGGDQNPHPRGTLELAEKHGRALAEEVRRVLAGPLVPVGSPVRSAYEDVRLDFPPQDRERFKKELEGTNRFARRRAEQILAAMDAGKPIDHARLPVQVVRLGDDVALVALGGEVVVDFALRLKREHPGKNLVVAAYVNDVVCYIPSERVLAEGGYEVDASMIYYGFPGPFAKGVEEAVIAACNRLLEATAARE